jgi:hypothetical protein
MLHAAPPIAFRENPFIGEWAASIEKYDYNIVFMLSNMCIITVKTIQDDREIIEEVNGTWSYDDDRIRINANFPRSKIRDLSRIEWVSVYSFNNNDGTAFNMNIPLPENNNPVRVSFSRIIKWD